MRLDSPEVAGIIRDFGVLVAYEFGSRARGQARPGSDLDVAVLTKKRPSLLDRQRLAERIRLATGAPDVDVVVLTDAPLELRGRVVQEGHVIFSDDEARRVAFEGRTRSEYFDYLPTLQEHTRRFLHRVAETGVVMVDPDRVRRLLGGLDTFVTELTELRKLPLDAYRGTAAYSGRYLVQASAQACLDIANHVISSEGFRVPADFRDAFSVLEEEGVLDARLAENMRALVGLRNRLVHLYGDVDDDLIHSYLADGLADMGAFAAKIASRFGL